MMQLVDGSAAGSMPEEGPSVRDYLEFGRLLGERPETVRQRLETTGGYPTSDDEADDYLRQCVAASWIPPVCCQVAASGRGSHWPVVALQGVFVCTGSRQP